MRIIKHIIIKEFQQFRRDPKMFGLVLIAPVVQLILLGYAATLELKTVHTLFYDRDKTTESREFISAFESSGFFSYDYSAENYNELVKYIDESKVLVAIVIPEGFSKKIKRKETADVQAIFDGSDGNSASIAAGYVARIIAGYSREISSEYIKRTGRKAGVMGEIIPIVRAWYNPNLGTRNYMVPGIVGLLLSIITLILTSLSVVKERETGTLEQIIITPIKAYQLIIGKLIPFTIVGFVSVIVVLAAMNLIFGIGVRGSLWFLFAASFCYILSTLGLGLYVSTISKTAQQAMMISIFGIMMPMVYLSGFAFPVENMPKVIEYISYLIPLKYFIIIIRGVILKGVGIGELWGETVILLVMGCAVLLISSIRFKKRI